MKRVRYEFVGGRRSGKEERRGSVRRGGNPGSVLPWSTLREDLLTEKDHRRVERVLKIPTLNNHRD